MRIDFYLLESEVEQSRWLLACRLIEKAYNQGHRIYAHCKNLEEAELLDELLWTFKEESFIPHNLQGEGPDSPPPVQIGYQVAPRGFHDILVNLSTDVPPFYENFKRMLELISGREEEKVAARIRYTLYKNRGHALHLHKDM